MIKNANSVKQILNNTIYGEKAQNGFDLSLKGVKRIIGKGVINKSSTELPFYDSEDFFQDGYFYLSQGQYSITFNEGGKIPQGNCGWIKTRSSLIRCGCVVESGLYDTGFECQNFGAILFVHNSIKIEQNAKVAQFILFEAEEAEEYDGQWQKEKDKK